MDLWENFVSGMSAGYPSIAEYDANVDVRYGIVQHHQHEKEDGRWLIRFHSSYFRPPEGIDCYPAPGPFLPCNDLFDWWVIQPSSLHQNHHRDHPLHDHPYHKQQILSPNLSSYLQKSCRTRPSSLQQPVHLDNLGHLKINCPIRLMVFLKKKKQQI